MRICDLARELGVDAKEVVEKVRELGLHKRPSILVRINELSVLKVRAAFEKFPVESPVEHPIEESEENSMPEENIVTNDEIEPIVAAPTVAKREPTIPWAPARILDIPEKFKDPAFTYRWVNKDKAGNLRKKQSEGWEIDKELTRKMSGIAKPIQDGSPMDGTIQVREMIVMRLPQERAEARKAYYRDKNARSIKDKEAHFKNEVGGGYGEIREN